MQLILFILLGIETIALLSVISLFFSKSHKYDNTVKELTTLKKLEEKQVELQKQRDDYLAMLVHELRAPLAVIKGAADLIIREAQNLSKEQIETLLGQIKKSSGGLLQIVNDILDVSKLDSGKFSLNPVDGDINVVLKEVADYYLSSANEKQIKLIMDLNPDIRNIKFDADRIKQVLNNLISNALKFTDEYGSVTIKSAVDQNRVQVSVSDTGYGIPEEMKHKLFNKFVQVPNQSHTKEKGTGLGLFIAKGIVEAHGGYIWIEDNSPRGSRFVFTLPIAM